MSEWPIGGDARRSGAAHPCALPRLTAPSDRARKAAAELWTEQQLRLSDRDRSRVALMLQDLVRVAERDLRATMLAELGPSATPELEASLAAEVNAIASPRLFALASAFDPALIEALLRYAGQIALGETVLGKPPVAGAALAADPDAAVGSAAMALMVEASRRLDAFAEPRLLLDDLEAEPAQRLVWTVAAALRHYLLAEHGLDEAEADRLAASATAARLLRHDEGRGLAALAARLAQRLQSVRGIDGGLLRRVAASGDFVTLTEMLAMVTGHPGTQLWPLVSDPADGRLALLLRAAACEREAAAALLLLVSEAVPGLDPLSELDLFDSCDLVAARRALAPLAYAGPYRSAIVALQAVR